MLLKNSRYQKPVAARRFEAQDVGEQVFAGLRAREIPFTPGVIEHVISAGERLDTLAYHYYNDARLWWRIVDANPDILFGGDIVLDAFAGQTLLIPKAKE